jgi:hypothetical protein
LLQQFPHKANSTLFALFVYNFSILARSEYATIYAENSQEKFRNSREEMLAELREAAGAGNLKGR